MKYQISGGGWPIGGWLIPAGTIIDLDGKAEHQLTEWERLARGRVPPRDAIALDDEAYALMVKQYEIGPRPVWRVARRGE
jgi:hypothetical protein